MDCAARGEWAGNLAASTPTSWGNNWTAYFRAPGSSAPMPYDVGPYGGVSFWAAFGAENGPSFGVPFGIVTMDTTTPTCSTHCSDHYMTTVTLTRDWQRYEIRFDDLAQEIAPRCRCAAIRPSGSSSGRSSSATSGLTMSGWNP